jgi:hypothetical protein
VNRPIIGCETTAFLPNKKDKPIVTQFRDTQEILMGFGFLVLGFWLWVLNPRSEIPNHLSHFVPGKWDKK